ETTVGIGGADDEEEENGYFVAPAIGDSFESALCLLRDQVGAVCFDKYKQLFVQIYSRPHAVFTILS
ncbi:unnamed protein product, partial [Rotaria sp. Silwood1]